MSHSATILYLTGYADHAEEIGSKLSTQELFDIITVSTAAEAIEEISEQSDIQCLLVAYKLPDTDGITFLQSFREDNPDLPVVLYPKEGSKDIAVDAISANATEYIEYSSETIHLDQLVNTIKNAIQKGSQLQSLQERVKELRAIQEIINILEDPIRESTEIVFQEVTEVISESFQYPSVTEVQLRVDEMVVSTDGYTENGQCLRTEITCADETSIILSVCYTEAKPDADEGPFLLEERNMCETILIILRSTIERRRYLEDLRESELLFRQLAENITEVAWISRWPDGSILFVNSAYEELWGQSVDSLYQDPQAYLETVHPEDRQRVIDAVQRQRTGAYDEEYRIIHPDGAVHWVHDRAVPVINDEGDVYRIVGLTADITARKEHEQQLAVLNRIVRHNLRNELNIVLSNAELLSADAATQSASDRAQQVIDASERLMTVADKQRAIANQLTNSVSSDFVPLNNLVQTIVESLQTTYEGSEITVLLETEAYILVPSQIEAALEELLVNAIEHTEDKPNVAVETRFDTTADSAQPTQTASKRSDSVSGTVVLTITDNGPGISLDEIEKLGDEEEALDHGSSVGLWLVYWLLSRAGGTISFDHVDPHGTRVTVTLPKVRRSDD